jgi:hypothetical protein
VKAVFKELELQKDTYVVDLHHGESIMVNLSKIKLSIKGIILWWYAGTEYETVLLSTKKVALHIILSRH